MPTAPSRRESDPNDFAPDSEAARLVAERRWLRRAAIATFVLFGFAPLMWMLLWFFSALAPARLFWDLLYRFGPYAAAAWMLFVLGRAARVGWLDRPAARRARRARVYAQWDRLGPQQVASQEPSVAIRSSRQLDSADTDRVEDHEPDSDRLAARDGRGRGDRRTHS